MKREPLVLQGRRISRFRASFILFKETFRFFLLDKETFWVPILTVIAQLFLIGLACVLIFIPAGVFEDTGTDMVLRGQDYLILFLIYLISAFTMACAEAVITHIVYTRAHGGDATLGDGFGMVGKYAGPLFLWACITSTVGVILRAIAERSQLLMSIVALIIGAAWSVLTYFTVPSIVLGKNDAIGAIRHSGSVFKRTWGEMFISNISLGLAFFIFILGLICVFIGGLFVFGSVGSQMLLPLIVLFVILLVGLSILSSVLNSILKVLLYMYASEGVTPQNFNPELIEKMLLRHQLKTTVPPPSAPIAPSSTV